MISRVPSSWLEDQWASLCADSSLCLPRYLNLLEHRSGRTFSLSINNKSPSRSLPVVHASSMYDCNDRAMKAHSGEERFQSSAQSFFSKSLSQTHHDICCASSFAISSLTRAVSFEISAYSLAIASMPLPARYSSNLSSATSIFLLAILSSLAIPPDRSRSSACTPFE